MFLGTCLLGMRSEGPEAMPGSTPLPTPLPLQASEWKLNLGEGSGKQDFASHWR